MLGRATLASLHLEPLQDPAPCRDSPGRQESAREMGDQQLVELPNGGGVTVGLELLTDM